MPRRRARSFLPGLIPLGLGVAVALVSSAERGAILIAIGLALVGLVATGFDVAGAVERAVTRVVHVVGAGLGALAFAVLVLPVWAVRTIVRRGPTFPDRGAWSTTGPAGRQAPARRSTAGRVTWAIGCVTLVLVTNFALGWGWDAATGTSGRASLEAATIADRTERPRDPRNDVEAMAAYPWRAQYFDDLQRTPGTYWPFTEYRPLPFTSPHINIDGWTRRSHEPESVDHPMPTVWMFGGSTTFGEGQRDGWTIASWLSRLAEADGIPIQVSNYGQRGWTHFQEMILYEQQLALGPPPTMAVFYDGLNEIDTQALIDEAVPTHFHVQAYSEKLFGSVMATQFTTPRGDGSIFNGPSASGDESSALADAWYAYSRHSAIHKVANHLRSPPAGAAPLADGSDDSEEAAPTPQDGTDAGRVYERGRAITEGLSAEHDVQALFFWQPYMVMTEPLQRARAELSPETIDISTLLLDHPEVSIDGAHTNEEGARIVAEEIWTHLEPEVTAWYEEQ